MENPKDDRPGPVGHQFSRRRLLRDIAGAGAATALVTGGGRAARVAAATSPEWDQTVAAAKKEGKVAINTFTGQGYGRVLKLFAQAYPEIKVDHTNLEPVELSPRVINERKAGVYTWDVATMPMTTALQVLKPAGVWDPVRPAIIAPEAKNDASWRGGFEAGFLDKDKRLASAFTLVRAVGVFVNVDRVKDGELKTVKDLLAPRWKGKIAISDPVSSDRASGR
jgi:iron(III) transport system substrate-binding protein